MTKSLAARELVKCAAVYAANGYSIIPLHSPQGSMCSCGDSGCGKPGKHPRIAEWQKASCDPAQVAAWWAQWPNANVGLRLDSLAVLDVDGEAGLESLAQLEKEYGPLDPDVCIRQRSGSGGWHYAFEAVPSVEKHIKFRPGLDLLTGPGCYIVCAPSLHASGGTYEWVDECSPLTVHRKDIPLPVPPGWLLEAASGQKTKGPRVPAKRILSMALDRIRDGSGRNDAGLWLFTQLRDNEYSRDEASLHLRDWVSQANDATPGQDKYVLREAEATLRSAYKRDARPRWGDSKENKPGHADILLSLIEDFEYFKSGPANDAYVRMAVGDHLEVWKVDSKGPKVREILTHRFLIQENRAPSREALNTVIDTVMAKCGLGPKVEVHTRFARSRDAIYLDMCDEHWRVIEVNKAGWRVMLKPPVLFKRAPGARPLPVPVSGGTLEALRSLVNIGDDSQWYLMVAWLAGAFLPMGAFHHLVIEGEQGSAKTTTCRILQSLLDPSDAGLSAPPKDETDATVSALHAGILAYDNMSGCRADIADVFCRFSTGQGYKTRTFYENLGVTVASVKLPILINGIDATVMRGDLLERSLILKCPTITPENRLTEEDVWANFDALHPTCLGSLLDAVSTGLRNLPNTTLTEAPRMSDFCKWIVACEPALPWKPGQFIRNYRQKMKAANSDLVESDSVASAIIEWANTSLYPGASIEIVAKDLLIQLNDLTREWPKDLKHWPLSPEALAYRLPRLAPSLRAHGVEVRRLPRTSKAWSRWEIWRNDVQGSLVPRFIADDCREAA